MLHTVRDPDKWFDSTQATIFNPQSQAVRRSASDVQGRFFESFMGPMREHLADRAFMTDYFRRHTEAVKAAIAPERLLIFEVGEGWPRLCEFLGVPVPEAPYPSENSTADFQARVRAAQGDVATAAQEMKNAAN